MGWWKVQGTDNVIGDGPLEALEGAIAEILAQYRDSHGRKPTRAEWESLLRATLGGANSQERVTDDGIVDKVRLELQSS